MASEPAITLYEPASSTGRPWNPISLKARFALRFKGIPFKSIQLEYPDIEPTLRGIGAAPTTTKPNGQPYYTVPVIVDSSCHTADGGPMIVSDSWAIAKYLDNAYPTSERLFPEGTNALQELFNDHFNNTVFLPGSPITVALVLPFLNEVSRPYWRLTREAYFGNKLEDICPQGSPKWEEVWEVLKKGFAGLAALLDKNGTEGGPYVMGNTVSFIDFVIAATLETVVEVIPEEWETVKQWDSGRWEKLRDKCSPWRTITME